MCISRARSTWGTQWPKDIQLSENLKFEASTTQRLGTRGNSKLLGRIMVIVFNVPSSYIYHFPKFLKIRGATPFAGYHSIHQIWACANLFGTLIYSTYKISSIFLMAILEAKKKKFKIQKLFLHLLKSVNNKHTFFEFMSSGSVHPQPPQERLHSGRETWLGTVERISALSKMQS